MLLVPAELHGLVATTLPSLSPSKMQCEALLFDLMVPPRQILADRKEGHITRWNGFGVPL